MTLLHELSNLSIQMLLFLIVAGFAAAFIDSVVGGGGLISVPALMLTGLPPTVVLGTNKLAGTMSSLTSSISFLVSGRMNVRLVLALFPLSLAGSAIGTYIVTLVPSSFLKPLVVVLLLVITLYTLLSKKPTHDSDQVMLTPKTKVISGIVAFSLGFYDGFFGPGTGSLLLFGFVLLGFSFVQAAGNAKALNFASNIASLVTFILLGKVNFLYGLPMGLSMIAGAFVGSQLAIRKGSTYVKPLFIVVTLLLVSKQLWDFL